MKNPNQMVMIVAKKGIRPILATLFCLIGEFLIMSSYGMILYEFLFNNCSTKVYTEYMTYMTLIIGGCMFCLHFLIDEENFFFMPMGSVEKWAKENNKYKIKRIIDNNTVMVLRYW